MKSARRERGRKEARAGSGREGGLVVVASSWSWRQARRRPMWSPSSRLVMGSPTDGLFVLFRLANNFRGRKVLLVGQMETRHISYILGGIMFENT